MMLTWLMLLQAARFLAMLQTSRNPAVVNMPGALVLPHLGASTEESEENCAVMAVNQIMDYLENGNIENSVNYPSCSLGYRKKASRI